MRKLDFTNQKFGRLLFLQEYYGNRKDGKVLWFCRCDCGKICLVTASSASKGAVKSCGCITVENTIKRNTKHGFSKRSDTNKLYMVWQGMKARCSNKNHFSYNNYGGRGIKVCERWVNSFENFLADMGERPSDYYSIERIDNNGNYEPSNCKWANDVEQQKNTSRSRLYNYKGKPHTIIELAELFGTSRNALYHRLVLKKHTVLECEEFYKNKNIAND